VLTTTFLKTWPCYEMDTRAAGSDVIVWYDLSNEQGHEIWYMNVRGLYRSGSLIQLQL